MPLVLKWQGYRDMRVLCKHCILKIHGMVNMHQVLNMPKFCMYQQS